MESSKAHHVPLNIFIDAHNHNVKVATNEATFRSSTTSFGELIKKSNIQFVEEEY
jgi:hypothetical protein